MDYTDFSLFLLLPGFGRVAVMTVDHSRPLDALRAQAQTLEARSHVPFSSAPSAALVLLGDGHWIPGVRVDSAAFSLSLPALMNAVTTAVALDRTESMVAFVLSTAARPADRQYVDGLPGAAFDLLHGDVFIRADQPNGPSLPAPTGPLDPFVAADGPAPADRVAQARRIADRALTPASGFPVGTLLEIADGRLLPGVNVEHDDWNRILCAERNALGTAHAYGVADAVQALYLSCPLDADGTPCGACRQWLVELAPDITLWMDRDGDPPEQRSPRSLLPGSFSGQAIPRSTL